MNANDRAAMILREQDAQQVRDDAIRAARRCATCGALLDGTGRCWACVCVRCDARGGVVTIADSLGDARVCLPCGGEWLDVVAADHDASLPVFLGTASSEEIAEHDRVIAARIAEEQAAAGRKAREADTKRRNAAAQQDAVMAVITAADGPIRAAAIREAVPFGVNAAERALGAATKAGLIRRTHRGYILIQDQKAAA